MVIDIGSGLLWGLIASAAMITILQGSQSLGLSRLNLPFLIGTIFTPQRHRAIAFGLLISLLAGWLAAFVYIFIFEAIGYVGWWLGGLIGLLHGVGLIALLQLLPHIHPRVASEYDGPTSARRIEPPGPFGLNYGPRTPLTTLLAQLVYGLILGAFYTPVS